MCEWEQECSDNPLLFNPDFACQFIKEHKLWLINKQSMCAKCKLQLVEHWNNHQADNTANKINISEHLSIKKQCHDYNSDAVPNSIDIFPFQDFNSCKLIKEQDAVHDKKEDAQNLIKGDTLKLQVQFF